MQKAKAIIKKELSGYAAVENLRTGQINWAETHAEAMAAYVRNGKKAGKFAVELLKEWRKTLSAEEQAIFVIQ
jgi:hypothetical protein